MALGKIWCALFALVLVESCSGFLGPLHASCKIDWSWPQTTCTYVHEALVQQIKTWNDSNCGNGEKCLYQLVSDEAKKLVAKHETPKKHYLDDLTFTFTPASEDTGCKVHGESRSETWYAVLDYGTNYCNLHNLITGAGLDTQPGYVENTSDSICTQYTSANCNKY